MPPRSSWKGFVNLSLVSVAVKAYTASSEGSQLRLNQLHDECNSRIRLQKTCPTHGEVPNDEIVMGYEYAKDQYVRIDLDELDRLRNNGGMKSITISSFVSPDRINPIYYSDANYYLLPDGAAGQKPFQLVQQAMTEMNVYCVGTAILHKKEQLVLIRPVENLLCMTVLKYAHQIKTSSSFDDEIAEIDVSKEELNLAKTLIKETTKDDFELNEFKDEYTEKLTQLIEAKVNGEEIVAAPPAETRNVINLMDALKASVSKAQEAKKTTKAATKKAPKKAAKKKASGKQVLAESLSGKSKKTSKKSGRKTG